MKKISVQFSTATTDLFFDAAFDDVKNLVRGDVVFITDENIFAKHAKKFKGKKTIVLPPGEAHKNQHTADGIVEQLIGFEADRKTTLVGVGGGVVTDITGYVAAIYMRGIACGFVPTTLLAMVDASIGGKNGVDVGVYKNIVGIIRQPKFLLYDVTLLKTLPDAEWINGFAEIIKHACIKDAAMFKQLQSNTLKKYQRDKTLLQQLVQRNATLKTKVVQADEFEQGDRKLLNYGHTLGHAIETQYGLSHGQAISIGMVFAATLSKQLTGFKQGAAVVQLLQQYGLPVTLDFDKKQVFDVLKMDKKRERSTMNYILLEKIGKGVIKSIELDVLETLIQAV